MSRTPKTLNSTGRHGKAQRKQRQPRAPRTLNVTEQHQLLDALLNKDAPHKTFRRGVRNYLMACLMLEAGLRVGEVVKLRMSHLYFSGKPVQNLILSGDITKNHVERTIWVSTRLKQALKEYLNVYIFIEHSTDASPAFHRPDSELCITTRQVERIIDKAGMKAIGRPVNPHMLRHTFATKLMRVTDTKTVQELLGHSDMGSTQIYMHPNEQDKKNAIEQLDSAANGVVDPSTRPTTQ